MFRAWTLSLGFQTASECRDSAAECYSIRVGCPSGPWVKGGLLLFQLGFLFGEITSKLANNGLAQAE
jgi:hypothetical protein